MKRIEVNTLFRRAAWAFAASLLATVAQAQTSLTDIGSTAPTPGPNDISQFSTNGNQSNPDGLDYNTDIGADQTGYYQTFFAGQSFTTGSLSNGYVLNSVSIRTAGLGGTGEGFGASQSFTLNIYSLSGVGLTNATLLESYVATATIGDGDWIQWTGLTPQMLLAPNTVYAYGFGRSTSGSNSYSLGVATSNPYSGGQIGVFPATSGPVTYGSSGGIDATFDIGLSGQPLVMVPGTADIFGSGHATPPDLGGGGGTLPPQVEFPQGGYYVRFPSVTGGVSFNGDQSSFLPPDGETGQDWTFYNISSYDGISGLVDSVRGGFLVGVFMDDTEPTDPAPPILTYTETTISDRSFSPILRQTFFIGDGLTGTGSGTLQLFYVPTGATRLFLGFLDAGNWAGPPGAYEDNSGQLSVSVDVAASPVITQQPISITANRNSSVAFSVTATGTPALSYQWQFDGTNLSSATGTTLNLPDVQASQAGTYCVVVTNAFGSAISSNAFLTVIVPSIVPPSITNGPANLIINQGGTAAFSVIATGSPPLAYQWWFGNSPIAGATTNSLAFPATALTNVGYYSAVVSNAAGVTTSSNASLTFFNQYPYAALSITNPIPGNYAIQSKPFLGGTNWTTLTNATLTTNAFSYIDDNPATNAIEIYRALFTP